MWPIPPSGRLPIVALVGRYPANWLIGRELTPNRIAPFTPAPCDAVVLCGISTCFQVLSPCLGQIVHALLTRPPLEYIPSSRSLPQYIPVRLACVKHAASVRPEPGSNSDVQSFPTSQTFPQELAKALASTSLDWRFTHRILTSHKPFAATPQGLPKCLFAASPLAYTLSSLYRFQGSLAAVLNPCPRDSLLSISKRIPLVNHHFWI